MSKKKLIILFNRSLIKEILFVVTGILFIIASIVFIEKFLPMVMDTPITKDNRLFLVVMEVYFIITALLAILYHKSIDLKNILLFGISSMLCVVLFLGYDYYRTYSKFAKRRSALANSVASNSLDPLFTTDDKLGWKLIANNRVTFIRRGIEKDEIEEAFDVDENGFKRINNSKNPDFSIYFFGDSFTFGSGVKNEDTFANIIKDKYLKKEINVYNAGVNAYGIVQMFQQFLIVKDRLNPGDLVILSPISEDIKRNLTDFYFPYVVKFTNLFKVDRYPFYENGKITSRKLENSFYNKLKMVALMANYTGNFFKSIRNRFIPDTTKESLEMMEIIERETKLKGGKFALFFLPKTGECIKGSYAVDISAFNYFDIMHFFPSEAKEANKLQISKTNPHWKVHGHEIAAKAIIETLINEGILDEKHLKDGLIR